jgi:hypothetical protein
VCGRFSGLSISRSLVWRQPLSQEDWSPISIDGKKDEINFSFCSLQPPRKILLLLRKTMSRFFSKKKQRKESSQHTTRGDISPYVQPFRSRFRFRWWQLKYAHRVSRKFLFLILLFLKWKIYFGNTPIRFFQTALLLLIFFNDFEKVWENSKFQKRL